MATTHDAEGRASADEPAAPAPAGRVDLVIKAARDALDVRRVVGEPVVHGDTFLLPVARVSGGSGMGFGSGTLDARGRAPGPARDAASTDKGARGGDASGGGQGSGGGGGFGASARALGVYVVRDGKVTWLPAVDVTRVILTGQAVGAVAVVSLAWALRRRRRR